MSIEEKYRKARADWRASNLFPWGPYHPFPRLDVIVRMWRRLMERDDRRLRAS